MKRRVLPALIVLISFITSAPLAAQVIDGDNTPQAETKSTEWEFIDTDSTTTVYVRGGFGFSTLGSGRLPTAVRKAFEEKFGEAGNAGSGVNGGGLSFSASGFYKLNRFLSVGATANISPLISISQKLNPPAEAPSTSQPDGIIISQLANNAFTQSLFFEAAAQLHLKFLIIELGAGLNLQRIGDTFSEQTVEIKNQVVVRQESYTAERRAYVFSPFYSVGIGLNIFLTEQFSLVPMYKGFLWQYGDADGATSDLKLALQMKF